jgi:hypothetical protein
MNPWHKYGFILLLVVWWRVASQVTLLGIPVTAVTVVSDLLWPLAVVALARCFRGEGEPVQPPRPWWRLTARPMIGWFIGGYYVLMELLAFVLPVHVERYPLVAVSVVCGIFLGVAFLNSSIRLTAFNRRARRAQ